MIEEFEKEGVDTSKIVRLEGVSGIAIIHSHKKGRNILVHKGVSRNFNKDHIPEEYIKNAKFLHLTSIISKNAISAFEHASAVAKKNNVKVIFDPGQIMALPTGRLSRILKNCYAILPSEKEARMMTGMKKGKIEKVAEKLLDYGTEVVVITRGENGCLLASKNLIKNIPAAKTRVVDTTGAGDAFSAGFIAALLDEKDVEEACVFGNKVAAASMNRRGARAVRL